MEQEGDTIRKRRERGVFLFEVPGSEFQMAKRFETQRRGGREGTQRKKWREMKPPMNVEGRGWTRMGEKTQEKRAWWELRAGESMGSGEV